GRGAPGGSGSGTGPVVGPGLRDTRRHRQAGSHRPHPPHPHPSGGRTGGLRGLRCGRGRPRGRGRPPVSLTRRGVGLLALAALSALVLPAPVAVGVFVISLVVIGTDAWQVRGLPDVSVVIPPIL